jgi:hypothetical protein
MLFVPVNIHRQIKVEEQLLVAGRKIPVRLTPVDPLLEQLGILDLKDYVYAYAATMGSYSKIRVHRDEQYPVKWSLIIPPVGHEDVNVEIVSIKQDAKEQDEDIGLTPIGTHYSSYREEDCVLIESWNLKYGACYFNPTEHWHRAVNNTSEPKIIFSIRSAKIEIDEILNRLV